MLAGELIELVKDIRNKRCELQSVELKAAEKGCHTNYMIQYHLFQISKMVE